MAFTGEARLAFDAGQDKVYRPVVLSVHPRDDRSCVLSFRLNGCIELARVLLGGGDPMAIDEGTRTITWPAVSFNFGTPWEFAAFQKLANDCERVFGMRQLQETLERDVGIPVEHLPSYQPLPRDWLPTHPKKAQQQQRQQQAAAAGSSSSGSQLKRAANAGSFSFSSPGVGGGIGAAFGLSSSSSSSASSASLSAAPRKLNIPSLLLRPDYVEAASAYVLQARGAEAPAALLRFFGPTIFSSDAPGGSSHSTCHSCHKSNEDLLLCNRLAGDDEVEASRRARHGMCKHCLAKKASLSFAKISSGQVKYCCLACAGLCSCAECRQKNLYRGAGSIWCPDGVFNAAAAGGGAAAAAFSTPGPASTSGAMSLSAGTAAARRASNGGSGAGSGAGSGMSVSLLPAAVAAAVRTCPGVPMLLTEGTECILDCLPPRRNKVTGQRIDDSDDEAAANGNIESEEEEEDDGSGFGGGGGGKKGGPNAPTEEARNGHLPRLGISYRWRYKYSRADLGGVWSVIGASANTTNAASSSASASGGEAVDAVNSHFLPLKPLPSANGIVLASAAAAAAAASASGVAVGAAASSPSSSSSSSSSAGDPTSLLFNDGSGSGGNNDNDEMLTAMMIQAAAAAAATGGTMGGTMNAMFAGLLPPPSLPGPATSGVAAGGDNSSSSSAAAAAAGGTATSSPTNAGSSSAAAAVAATTTTSGGASSAAAAVTGIGILGVTAATLASGALDTGRRAATPLGKVCSLVSAFNHRKCLLCACVESRASSRRRIVGLHPLVPIKQSGKEGVWTCERCHAMILGRRKLLAIQGELLDENDGYETCCTLCGHGGPALQAQMRLTCCSAPKCPRSYCRTCIELLLTPREVKVMEEDPEWRCPPCKAYSDLTVTIATNGVFLSSSIGDYDPALFPSASGFPSSSSSSSSSHFSSGFGGGRGQGRGRGKRGGAVGGMGKAASKAAYHLFASPPPAPLPSPAGFPSQPPPSSSSSSSYMHASIVPFSSPASAEPGANKSHKKPPQPSSALKGSSSSSLGAASSSAAPLVPVASNFDPVVYFSAYAKAVRRRCSDPKSCLPTEDECFVCRDGGDVFECDYSASIASSSASAAGSNSNARAKPNDPCRCTKVYHADCLGYSAPDNIKWECPRHRCRDCAGKAVALCRYCPNSLCQPHLDKLKSAKAKATAATMAAALQQRSHSSSSNSSNSAAGKRGKQSSSSSSAAEEVTAVGAEPLTIASILIPLSVKSVRTKDLLPSQQVMVCSQCRLLRDEAIAKGSLTVDAGEVDEISTAAPLLPAAASAAPASADKPATGITSLGDNSTSGTKTRKTASAANASAAAAAAIAALSGSSSPGGAIAGSRAIPPEALPTLLAFAVPPPPVPVGLPAALLPPVAAATGNNGASTGSGSGAGAGAGAGTGAT